MGEWMRVVPKTRKIHTTDLRSAMCFSVVFVHCCWNKLPNIRDFPHGSVGKEFSCNARDKRCEYWPWVRKIPWRRKWQPTPVFLPEKFYGQRNLAAYSPWGLKELDISEHCTALKAAEITDRNLANQLTFNWASLVVQLVNNLPAMWEIWVRSWVGKILSRSEL